MEGTGFIGRRRGGQDRDWTKGNIFHNLLRLSWPMVVTNTLMMVGPTIDMIWVGKLGSASIAAVTVAGTAVMFVMTAMMGLMMGMRAMISRFIGEGNPEGANHVAQQTFVISTSFSILIAIVGVFFSHQLLEWLGAETEVLTEGTIYMRIMFVGAAAMSFRVMAEGIMQASGDAVTPMWVAVFYRIFHVVLCPFLIFGWWIFPEMGISGAAATNIFSQGLAAVIMLWLLFTGHSRLKPSLRNFSIDLGVIWRVIKIGFPALISGMQRSLSYMIIVRFMFDYAGIAVSAHGIVQRVEMLLMMPAMAFGMASGVLVGQNLGAQQPERAEKSAWLAVALVEGFVIILSAVILLWPGGIVRIFNSEPALVEIASDFLRIAVAGYVCLGLMGVLMQSLSGAGDTVPTAIVGVLAVWAVTLPLAFFLPKITDLGMYGVRWGMASGMIFSALVYTIYFRTGRWKRKKV